MMILLAIVFYVFVASVVGTMIYRSLKRRGEASFWFEVEVVGAFIGGLWWPPMIVILFGVWIGRMLDTDSSDEEVDDAER